MNKQQEERLLTALETIAERLESISHSVASVGRWYFDENILRGAGLKGPYFQSKETVVFPASLEEAAAHLKSTPRTVEKHRKKLGIKTIVAYNGDTPCPGRLRWEDIDKISASIEKSKRNRSKNLNSKKNH